MSAIDQQAEHWLKKLIKEVQSGIFHESKLDHLYSNPSEFIDEFMGERVLDRDRGEIINCMKQTVWKGFWKQLHIRSRNGPGQVKKGDPGGCKPKWL
jgi:hypothetical protein